jgi:Xaa-Pro aminopeptidase
MHHFPTIPESEFGERIHAFKKKMDQNAIDLVVLYANLLDPSAVRYFSDFSPINESAAMLIPLEAEPILCSGQACHAWSRYTSKVSDIRVMPEVGEVSGVEYNIEGQIDFRDLFEEIKSKLRIKRIGITGDLIFPYEIYKKLQETFKGVPIGSAEDMMTELRMKKSAAEIACIKKAADIITETFAFAAARIRPGISSELDIQADLESQMLRLGAEGYCNSFAPMVPSGPAHSNLCMNRNTLRKIQDQEIVDLQAGCLYEGYNAVICSPVVTGKVPQDIKKAVMAAYEALHVVQQSMRPGVSSKDLYRTYNDFLDKKGYREFSPYGSVHSIGLLECESPFFSADRDVWMQEDMAVAVDVYFKGLPWGSFRIEDTYIIRNDGAELITGFNEKFIEETFR